MNQGIAAIVVGLTIFAAGCKSEEAPASASHSAAPTSAPAPAAGGCAAGATKVENMFCVTLPSGWKYVDKKLNGTVTEFNFSKEDGDSLLVQILPDDHLVNYTLEPNGKGQTGDLLNGKGKWMRWTRNDGTYMEYAVKVQGAKNIFTCSGNGQGPAAAFDAYVGICKTIVPTDR